MAMELVDVLVAVLGGVCESIISVAEFLVPPLRRYLTWEIETFGPLVPVSNRAVYCSSSQSFPSTRMLTCF